MTPPGRPRAEAARLLREAERCTAPIEPLSTTLPGLDLADAYAVQRDNIARRLATGATVIGHKVGLTSAAMQQLLGVHEPDFGHLLDDMVHRDGGTVRAARYCAPRVEPEICHLQCGSDRLGGGQATGGSPWSTPSRTTPAPRDWSAAPGHRWSTRLSSRRSPPTCM